MMQNSKGSHNAEPRSANVCRFMQEKIYEVLSQRQTGEMPPKNNILDLLRRLEEGLYETARTKEEYTNLETLETRIHLLLRHTPPNNQNQRYQQQNNPNVAMGTMLPTPGLPQSGNSNLVAPSSTDNTLVGADGGNSMVPSAGNEVNYSMNNTGLSRGLHTGSFSSTNGSMALYRPPNLTHHPSVPKHDRQNKLRKMLDLLVHASQCRSGRCPCPDCRKVKNLFRHGMHCKVHASGGCSLCKKMWRLLQLHARSCKDTPCHVPRCRELREHLRRHQQLANVMKMMSRCKLDEKSNIF